VKSTLTVWERLPLVPVIDTVKLPDGVEVLVPNVSVEGPVPPGETMTVVGLRLMVGQPMARHETGGVRLIAPLNPLMLARMIWEVAVEPAWTV
jgi:hypothetical protein